MMTPYHYLLSRFCLYCHLTRRIDPNQPRATDENVLKLAISAAFDFLSLFQNLDPQGMYRIRYLSGFCSETFAFCSMFVLRRVEAFPAWFCDMEAQLSLMERVAIFIDDLDIEGSNSRAALGQSLWRQIEATIKRPEIFRGSCNAAELSAANGSSIEALTTECDASTDGWHVPDSATETGIEIPLGMFDLDSWLDFV